MHVGTRLIYTGENDSRYFTKGLEYEIIGENGSYWYVTDNDGSASNGGYGHLWPKDNISDSFRPLPTGPVVTETVTKTRIVPGTYDRVHVTGSGDQGAIKKNWVRWHPEGHDDWSADELDAAAAVLSALAKGLRDVG